jgi:transcription elongation factor GreA
MNSTPITLGEAFAEYVQSLKPEQRRVQEPHIRKFVGYHDESRMLNQLSGSQVERYAEQEIKSTDPNAPERVQALKAWFQYLKKKDYIEANLGVHIRSRRPQSSRAGGASRAEDQPIEMTAAGHAELAGELESLEAQRNDLRKAVEVARSDGDLRENAPYHAAREALALVDSRFRQIEDSLRRAVVVERSSGDRASVGSIVTVVNLDDQRTSDYRLVSPREANAGERKISVESPVGKELLGRSPGDEVVVSTPRGDVRFRVESVSHA